MNNIFLWLILSSVCFSAWPIIMRFSKAPSAWIPLLYVLGTLPVALITLTKSSGKPNWNVLAIGLFAGILNGVGIWAYGKVITHPAQASTLLPIGAALVPVLTVVLAALVLHENIFTLPKLIGLIAVSVGIWLLTLS